ncbi:beta-lactamase family protein [Phenylobacterium sp. LH3H17]|uniref:serine hydrolase domain-containing protein n=1 Tax=Phenylobacterium sp. LH3H17 TaxID=2903901 RepID=UPI0020C9F29D|nr:serine hydrolase domain-containing protein [Phenylobacterium sp. LH3H17]UTP38200.1 beta-lactamase family protein [Phenylobacterium sp. LH3H17]
MIRDIFRIHGDCDARFAPVREAFSRNFQDHGEVGAAVAVMVGGQKVVDLWGGAKDKAGTQPWTSDTLVNVWSSTKGVNAICFAMLADRGALSYEDPVSKYWPEFGVRGKEAVTIGMLLSHQAGLSGFSEPAGLEDLLAGAPAAARLAAQAPFWPPGSGSGYHAISVGILSAELFRRIEGRSLKRFIADELEGRLGIDLSLGLPGDREDRVAEMIAPAAMESSSIASATPAQHAALGNPSLDPLLPNTAAWRAAELPSANGFTNARSLARLYASVLVSSPNRLLGETALQAATRTQVEGVDLVMGTPARWGAGFLLNSDGLYGPGPNSFGHSGWGGSFAFADPDRAIAISYTMNAMTEALQGDPRAAGLIDAVYRAWA